MPADARDHRRISQDQKNGTITRVFQQVKHNLWWQLAMPTEPHDLREICIVSVQTTSRESFCAKPGLAFWSTEQALRWAISRDVSAAETPQPPLPNFSAAVIYAGTAEEMQLLAAAQALVAALRSGRLTAFQTERPVHPSAWNDVRPWQLLRAFGGVMFASQDVVALFPKHSEALNPVTPADVLEWCIEHRRKWKWGRNRTWDDFKVIDAFKGLSRDGWFDPAFERAKALVESELSGC